jgi:hypothetical protein
VSFAALAQEIQARSPLSDFHIAELPSELVNTIVFFLPPLEVVDLETVSKEWSERLQVNSNWRQKFVETFGELTTTSKPFYSYMIEHLASSWKKIFFQTDKLINSLKEEIPKAKRSPFLFLWNDNHGQLKKDEEGPRNEVEKDIEYIAAIISKFDIDSSTADEFKFPDDRYLPCATIFLLFEHIHFSKDGNDLSYRGGMSDSKSTAETVNFAFKRVLNCSMGLLSSNTFPLEKAQYRKKVGKGLAEIFEQARGLGIPVRDDDEIAILSDAAMYMDEKNPREALKKKEMTDKVKELIMKSPESERVRCYNLACVCSQFREFEEARKYLHWTFNYMDDKYKSTWARPRRWGATTAQLADSLEVDQDFENVRGLPWFAEELAFAKSQLEEEKSALKQSEEKKEEKLSL